MVFSIVIVVFPSMPAPDAANMNYTVVVLAAWMSLCLAYYYCPIYGGVYWFRGPLTNVAGGEPDKSQDQGSSVLPDPDVFKEHRSRESRNAVPTS